MNEIELSVILERDINDSLDAELREALMECYPKDVQYFRKRSWWHSRPFWRVIAQEENGKIVAHTAIVLRSVQAGDDSTAVSVAGIQSVLVREPYRGTGLSDRIMERAAKEMDHQNLDAGMLFCMPKLEGLYGRMGWQKINAAVSFIGDSGEKESLLEDTTVMVYPVKLKAFPRGCIDLNGRDW